MIMTHTTEQVFAISDVAAQQILKVMRQRGMTDGGLRVGVKAGGCSGLSYFFDWDPTPKSTDHVIESTDGARVYVDPKSLSVLSGMVLDYDTSLLSKGFMLNNPNATSTCGCGTSFGIG